MWCPSRPNPPRPPPHHRRTTMLCWGRCRCSDGVAPSTRRRLGRAKGPCDNHAMVVNLGAILTAMVTPFGADGRIDEDAAVRLMHHLVDHGADGLVVCGTTGEAVTLTDDEQMRMIRLAVDEMKERCTIVAGVGSNDTRHAVELTEWVTEIGPDALLSVNPYYNRPSRRGIIRHYEEI